MKAVISRSALWLVLVGCITATACKGGSGQETAVVLSPSSPTPGVDTTQKTMMDGAGNAGPVRAQLIAVSPNPNSTVAPGCCFEFIAQICMDAVSNPTNSPLLSKMALGAFFSPDGTTPIPGVGFHHSETVTPGACQTWNQSQSGDRPDIPSGTTPRFLIVTASYNGVRNGTVDALSSTPCPPRAAIAAGAALGDCKFRVAYDLGYHFCRDRPFSGRCASRFSKIGSAEARG
jgi:hypothetical protein